MAVRSLDVCRSYLDCQIKCAQDALRKKETQKAKPFITISRQAGAGGITIGEKLIAFLRENDKAATCPWTLFDKELVTQVLSDHQLPKEFEKYMPEGRRSELHDTIEELFNLHPAQWTLVHKTSETILRLAQMGNAVLVGRGANLITQKIQGGLHVRLVASMKTRIQHAADYYHLSREQAIEFIGKEDKGRRDYIKANFDRNIDDPLGYDLIINTESLSYDHAAKVIGKSVLEIVNAL